jgi:hypothetical protein
MSVVITSRFMAVQNSSELQVRQQAAAISAISSISKLENAVQKHGHYVIRLKTKSQLIHIAIAEGSNHQPLLIE